MSFSVSAAMAALLLALRAFRQPVVTPVGGVVERAVRPYRTCETGAARAPDVSGWTFSVLHRKALERQLVAAGCCAYLALWNLFWSGGPWHSHVLVLDVALGLVLVVAWWQFRVRVAAVPLGLLMAHVAFDQRLIPLPSTRFEWGVAAVVMGFSLLGGSLLGVHLLGKVDAFRTERRSSRERPGRSSVAYGPR